MSSFVRVISTFGYWHLGLLCLLIDGYGSSAVGKMCGSMWGCCHWLWRDGGEVVGGFVAICGSGFAGCGWEDGWINGGWGLQQRGIGFRVRGGKF